MTAAATSFDAKRCGALLGTRYIGRSLTALAETGSTMDDARAAADEGADDGHVVLADHQTSGRGSHGRGWSSPPGSDLYFSVVLRPALELSDLPPLTLAVGLAVANTLADTLAVSTSEASVRIKWPNDVFVNGKKCAGVLVETRSGGLEPNAVIVGVGLNVNRSSFDPELAAESTSLTQVASTLFDREALLARLLAALEHEVTRFVDAGPAAIVRDVEARLLHRGERVDVDGRTGTLLGVDPDGALRVEDSDGVVRRLLSGRVRPIGA